MMKVLMVPIIVLLACLTVKIHGALDLSPNGKILSLPTPISEDELAWNTRALHKVPSIISIINSNKDEDRIPGVSIECSDDFKLYSESFSNLTAWALQMFDSSTKIPEGLASGAGYHLGNFDQCLAVNAYNESGQHVFNGQYCGTILLLTDQKTYQISFQMAFCVPSTCTPADFGILLQVKLGSYMITNYGILALVSLPADSCYIEGDKPPLDAASWVFISILICLFAMVLIFTLLDYLKLKNVSKTVTSIFSSFSLIKNFKYLMNTKHAPGSISSMHGLRVLSLFWIILGHCYEIASNTPMDNIIDLLELPDNVLFHLIMNAVPSVDTFFFMSGFLVCYILMKELAKGQKFNPIVYYIHRYLRLTTSFAIVVGFYATLYGDIGYGPMWRPAAKYVSEKCKELWWTGLLYIDNYYQPQEYTATMSIGRCATHAWYLTTDMQLAWLAPLILLPLYYWSKWAFQALILLVMASCLSPFLITYFNEFYMGPYYGDPDYAHALKYNMEMYCGTHNRATPYLIGICLAYLMIKKPKGIRLPKIVVLCGWVASTVMALTVLFSTLIMYQPGYENNVTASSFYNSFGKLAWSFVIGWILWACHYGYGGPVDKILSWNGWLPLSRLTYCMFLVHPYIIMTDIQQIRTLIHFNHYSMVQKWCGVIFMSVFVGSILHLVVEAPTLGLLKTFLRRSNKDITKETLPTRHDNEENKSKISK